MAMATARASSSADDLSSPPKSPESPGDVIVLDTSAYPDLSGHASVRNSLNTSTSSSHNSPSTTAKASTPSSKAGAAAEKPARAKPGRKPKVRPPGEATEKPAKPGRKPRGAPRKAKATASPAPTEQSLKVEPPSAASSASATQQQLAKPAAKLQQKITDLGYAKPLQQQQLHTFDGTNDGQMQASDSLPPAPLSTSQNGTAVEAIPRPLVFKTEASAGSSINAAAHLNPSNSPRSGQKYDPIRASAFDASSRATPTASTTPVQQISPTKPPNRASASPSISSLIDPPSTYSYTPPARPSPNVHNAKPCISPSTQSRVPQQQQQQPHSVAAFTTESTSSPKLPASSLSAALSSSTVASSLPPTTAMDIDTETVSPAPSKQPASRKPSISTNPSSKAPSPKPPAKKAKNEEHEKEKSKANSTSTPPLPPLPGSGTLSATLFGSNPNSDPSSADPSTSAPTVFLHVPLNGETNKYVNFARLAEERYGFNALHPRLAAQRDRLARVAAAGAALENASGGKKGDATGDEMSLDMSDGEADGCAGEDAMSNVEMGNGSGAANGNGQGGNESGGGGAGKPPRQKRKMKADQYDKEDPFVDDSELAWEEQAAASKDGFFVYSGPLVPEGEQARVERADGTLIKPASTRGRGRGSRGGATGSGTGSRGGGGPGSRGGGGPGSRGGRVGRGGRGGRGARAAAAAAAAAANGGGRGGGTAASATAGTSAEDGDGGGKAGSAVNGNSANGTPAKSSSAAAASTSTAPADSGVGGGANGSSATGGVPLIAAGSPSAGAGGGSGNTNGALPTSTATGVGIGV